MTRYSDNIYSGYDAITSALSSRSAVQLTKFYDFAGNGSATAVTRTGVFPPDTKNITTCLYITQQGSANVSNKITVSAGGTNLTVIDQFGSASGIGFQSTTSLVRFTPVASAMANPPVPTGANNGGEIPFAVTFLPVTDDTTGTYRLVINYSRNDTGGMAGTTS